MNSILVIHPYKWQGMWVFDDDRVGLVKEPFIAGADTVIERMVADIPDAENGFTLVFSARPFAGYQTEFQWRREEDGGNWYYSPALDIEGWLCPALFGYFAQTPDRVYAQFKPKAV